MEVYLDSIEAKTNRLKASWENFVMSLNQNESWGNVLDMLSTFLDKLTYVDWEKVIKVLVLLGGLAALTKVIGAIGSAITAISAAFAAGGTIAGIAATLSGILPALLAISAVVAAIAVGWKSVQDNTEATLKEIETTRKSLNEEEKDVRELYKRYSELEGKEKIYDLTEAEKQELVDITKTLVEQYGFEADGVDTLTGKYNLANDSLEKYLENLEKERRYLSQEEKDALKKDVKNEADNLKDTKTIYDYSANYRFGMVLPEEEKARILTDKEIDEVRKLQKELAETYLDENNVKNNLITGLQFTKEAKEKIEKIMKTLYDEYGVESTYRSFKGYDGYERFKKSIGNPEDYADAQISYLNIQQQKIVEQSKALGSKIAKYISAELGDSVSIEMEGIITDSLQQAFSTGNVTYSDEFLTNYINNFVEKINAYGEDIDIAINKYQKLQQKLSNGTLLPEEYNDYQLALQTYLALQRESLEATGLGKEKVDELMGAFENDAIDNFNIKLLELNENIQNGNFSEDAKRNFSEFSKNLSKLNGAFKAGEIPANEYFDTLNKKINNIDLSKLEETFGSVENFSATLGALASDTSNFIDGIITIFQGGGDSLEFYNKLAPAVNNLSTITNTLNGLNKQNKNVNITEELEGKSHTETRGQNVAKKIENVITTQGVWTPEQTEKRKEQVGELTEELEELKKTGKDLEEIEIIDEKGLNRAQNDLNNIMKTFEEWDLNSLDTAYETITSAFDNLEGDITSLVGTANNEVKNSAQEISNWLLETAKANNEYSQGAIQAIESMVDESGNKIKYSTDMSSEQLETLLLSSQKNLNSAQTAMNQAASTQMGRAVQALGAVLSEMGEAMDKLEIKIPIKVPNYKLNLAGFVDGTGIFAQAPDLESEVVIGGEGSSNSIGSALKSIGDKLQTKEFADTIGNAFSPVQSNYIPNPNTNDDDDGKGHTPPKDSEKGSKYSAEDAASDLKDILQDIEDYEADIELDLEDQTEQFINQEMLGANRLDRLKEELDYYNDIYDVTENTSKWLETQNKLLDNQSKKVGELQNASASFEAQKEALIRQNSNYDIKSWFDSEGNDTLAYGNLINDFAYRKEAIERETAAKMRSVYNSVANSTDKDSISAAKDKIKQIEEEGDIKIKALSKEQEKIENIHDSVSELNEAWLENQSAIKETLSELHDTVISIRDELLGDITEQLEKAVDKQNKSLGKDVTRLEQLVTIQEKYNDILNETIETQQELDSELQASLDSFEYLDEQMRQLMFNEDDYKILSETLTGIQEDIAGIWEDHYAQIDSLTDDEMYKAEYITAETERQLDMKMKEYELAKAELDVAKARTNLQNVQNERNVRMYVGGQWTWVNIYSSRA